jgi:hypothetical protein
MEYLLYVGFPNCKGLPEKLTVPHLVNKFPSFYGTRRFITASTSARQLSLSWASSIQSMPCHSLSERSTVSLPYSLSCSYSHWAVSFKFADESPLRVSLLPIRATCCAHLLTRFGLPNKIWLVGLQSIRLLAMQLFPFSCFLRLCVPKCLPQYLLIAFLQPVFFSNMIHQISHSHETFPHQMPMSFGRDKNMWAKALCVMVVFGYTEENHDFRKGPRYSGYYDHWIEGRHAHQCFNTCWTMAWFCSVPLQTKGLCSMSVAPPDCLCCHRERSCFWPDREAGWHWAATSDTSGASWKRRWTSRE